MPSPILAPQQLLQPVVFLLQIFEALGMLDFHASVFLAPPVIGLLADSKLLAGHGDRSRRGQALISDYTDIQPDFSE